MSNPNLQKIIKLTQAQYDTLSSGGTVGDYTGLNDNYLYLIQDNTEYITDVKVNNSSIVSGGVANIPLANTSTVGVVSTGVQTFAGAKTFNNNIYLGHSGQGGVLYLYDNEYAGYVSLSYDDDIFRIDGTRGSVFGYQGDTRSLYLKAVGDTGIYYQQFQAKNGNIALTEDVPTNIQNGTGTNAVQEKMTDATVNFTGRNAHAEAIDSSLSTTLNTGASGNQSAAFGKNTMALSTASFTNGNKTVAKGEESHAEGYQSVTLGDGSHAEGAQTVAAGLQSHSEGALTQALGAQSHAEGHDTIAAGLASHAEGAGTKIGSYSPASDQGADQSGGGSGGGGGDTPPSPGTFTAGEGSHAEGYNNLIVGFGSHAEGLRNYLTGNYAHVEGVNNTNSANYAHVEGFNNINSGEIGHVEGDWNNNSGYNAHVFGHHNTNTYNHKVVFGWYNSNKSNTILEVGKGDSSTRSNAFEVYQDGHAEIANVGTANNAITTKAYVDGGLALKSSATNIMNGTGAYSLKQADCTSSNSHSFAEGFRTTASGNYSHTEGADTAASADYAHAEGANTVASGIASHAGGLNTNAKLQAQTVIGKFNADAAGSLFIVGNGTADSTAGRSNAFVVYADGSAEVSGKTVATTDDVPQILRFI